jgi:hypothetical protein
MQEVEQVVGILAGSVEADDEVDRTVLLGQAFEALPQEGIAGAGLGELQLGSGGLQVVVEEGGVMAVAGGVDANAEAAWRLRGGRWLW